METEPAGRLLDLGIPVGPWSQSSIISLGWSVVGRWLRWKRHLAYPGEGGHRWDGLLIRLAVMAD